MQFRSPTFRLLSPFLIERPFIEVPVPLEVGNGDGCVP